MERGRGADVDHVGTDGLHTLYAAGVRVFVDPKSYGLLHGTELDYDTSLVSKGFIFNNPNQTGACGCGESVQLTAAKV